MNPEQDKEERLGHQNHWQHQREDARPQGATEAQGSPSHGGAPEEQTPAVQRMKARLDAARGHRAHGNGGWRR